MGEDDFLWFTSLELDGCDETREPIVKKEKKSKVSAPLQFKEDMLEFQDYSGEINDFCPYNDPWPNYQTMNQEQKNWYFFWRGQVREGWYPFTDLGYIYVLIFEYIHGFGWKTPSEGYDLLVALWRAYGGLNFALHIEFRDWIFDFILLHKLDFTPFLLEIAPEALSQEQTNLLYHVFMEENRPLPTSLLLLNYPHKAVIRDFKKEELWEFVELILKETYHICEKKCRRTRDTSLMRYYGTEKTVVYSRFCYQKAPYIAPKPSISYTVQNHAGYNKLMLFFSSFLDFTFHSLGNLWELEINVEDGVLGIGLEDEITSFLEDFYPQSPKKNQQLSLFSGATPRFSNLNFDALHLPEEENTIIPHSKSRKNRSKPLIDERKLEKLREEASKLERTLDFSNLTKDLPTPSLNFNKIVKKEVTPISLDFSEINKLREESDAVRDALLVEETPPEKDKVEEILPEYQVLSKDSCENKEGVQEISNEISQELSQEISKNIPEKYKILWENATEIQQKTLVHIAQKNWTALSQLAEESFSLVELLVDDINTLSMDRIGDILLEFLEDFEKQPVFLSEYKEFQLSLK